MKSQSPLQLSRLHYQPSLPKEFNHRSSLEVVEGSATTCMGDEELLSKKFPHLYGQSVLQFRQGGTVEETGPLRVGVVLSGGQAAGGHNVITGLHDALQSMDSGSVLVGFLDGPSGIVDQKYRLLDRAFLEGYRNQGGFDCIGSGRTKIESEEQLSAALQCVKRLELDGLVVIGGDDSNTNAAVLAEYFIQHDCQTKVIGVPKTIDGDLKSEHVEISFGCDTACKTYSAIIGDIARDCISAKKYYYFVKLMGRSASHIALECALQTHANFTVISEEVAARGYTLKDVVDQICNMVCLRAEKGRHYGVVLIPEGVIEFFPDMKLMIQELNFLLAPGKDAVKTLEHSSTSKKLEWTRKNLSGASLRCFEKLPGRIQEQLLLDRDPHGNVQVSKIETERLFIEMVKNELADRKEKGSYSGSFSAQPHFCGYEGRSCLPSNFDANYCFSLGYVAAALIQKGYTGYMACVRHLVRPVKDWEAWGIPLTSMMNMELRHGKEKPVIRKALVELDGPVFQLFSDSRKDWEVEDAYRFPGPIQFAGDPSVTDSVLCTLQIERGVELAVSN